MNRFVSSSNSGLVTTRCGTTVSVKERGEEGKHAAGGNEMVSQDLVHCKGYYQLNTHLLVPIVKVRQEIIHVYYHRTKNLATLGHCCLSSSFNKYRPSVHHVQGRVG